MTSILFQLKHSMAFLLLLAAYLACASPPSEEFPCPEAKDTALVVAVGDIMMGTMYPDGQYLPPGNDCSRSFAMVKPYFEGADILFGNLEGALIESPEGAKKCRNTEWCYIFGMPVSFATCLKEAGFDILSLANNHMGDFGATGRATTVQALTSHGIRYAGLLSCPVSVFEKNGIRYGFCAFAPNEGTVNINDTAAAEKIVKALNDSCDIVIVSFHAGAEGKDHQHVTRKIEMFLGENRGNVCAFARRMIDAGADILLGHGPHVTRAVEVYKNRFIAYSMGNFSTYSRVNVSGVNGWAPIFRIYTDRQGAFRRACIIPVWQPADDRTPRYDPDRRVIAKIQTLTRQDFPEAKITITDDGWITATESSISL